MVRGKGKCFGCGDEGIIYPSAPRNCFSCGGMGNLSLQHRRGPMFFTCRELGRTIASFHKIRELNKYVPQGEGAIWPIGLVIMTEGGCIGEHILRAKQMKPRREGTSRLQKTAYMRWSCHSGMANPVQIMYILPAQQQWGPDYLFGASRPCGPTGWLAIFLIKMVMSSSTPGLTTSGKQVWILDICHRQIQVRKQISIRCNMIGHWVLRCTGIRLTQ